MENGLLFSTEKLNYVSQSDIRNPHSLLAHNQIVANAAIRLDYALAIAANSSNIFGNPVAIVSFEN